MPFETMEPRAYAYTEANVWPGMGLLGGTLDCGIRPTDDRARNFAPGSQDEGSAPAPTLISTRCPLGDQLWPICLLSTCPPVPGARED